MEKLSVNFKKIIELLERNWREIIIFVTAMSFAIIHLFSSYLVDYITVGLIIIALAPLLAVYLKSIKIPGCEVIFNEMNQKIINDLAIQSDARFEKRTDKVEIQNKIKIKIDLLRKSILNQSPPVALSLIKYEIDRQFESYQKIIQENNFGTHSQILDKLVQLEIIKCEEKIAIKQSMDLIDRAIPITDIGPISLSVIINVGLRLIESLNEIYLLNEK